MPALKGIRIVAGAIVWKFCVSVYLWVLTLLPCYCFDYSEYFKTG